MGFLSFAGRVLFASFFILTAYQEQHILDGCPLWDLVGLIMFIEARLVSPMLNCLFRFSKFGRDGGPAAEALAPKYDIFVNHVSSRLGVKVPEVEIKYIVILTIVLRALGGLLFICSSSFGACLLLLYLALVTPIMFDFYNYDIEMPQFVQLFVEFMQNLALLGATLFFIGIKNSMPKKQTKKKTPKTKTT